MQFAPKGGQANCGEFNGVATELDGFDTKSSQEIDKTTLAVVNVREQGVNTVRVPFARDLSIKYSQCGLDSAGI